jgi:hypothetical protein
MDSKKLYVIFDNGHQVGFNHDRESGWCIFNEKLKAERAKEFLIKYGRLNAIIKEFNINDMLNIEWPNKDGLFLAPYVRDVDTDFFWNKFLNISEIQREVKINEIVS